MLKLDTRHLLFLFFLFIHGMPRKWFSRETSWNVRSFQHIFAMMYNFAHIHTSIFLLAIVFIRNTWRETARYFDFVYKNSTWFSIKICKICARFFASTYLRWLYAKLLLFLEFLSCFKITVSSKFVGSLKECKAFGVFSFNSLFKV